MSICGGWEWNLEKYLERYIGLGRLLFLGVSTKQLYYGQNNLHSPQSSIPPKKIRISHNIITSRSLCLFLLWYLLVNPLSTWRLWKWKYYMPHTKCFCYSCNLKSENFNVGRHVPLPEHNVYTYYAQKYETIGCWKVSTNRFCIKTIEIYVSCTNNTATS